MDGRKLLAAAFVTFALVGLVGGLGATIFGQIDEQEHQREPNPLAARTERNEQLELLGLGAAVVSIPLLGMGIAGFWPQGDRRARAPVALAVPVALLGVLFVAFGLDSIVSPAGAPYPLQAESISGALPSVVDLGPLGSVETSQSHAERIFLAPSNAALVVADVSWQSQGAANRQLIAILDVDPGTGWREVARVRGASPLALEADPEDLANASVRLRLERPEAIGSAPEQPFTATVAFWRDAPDSGN